MKPRVNLNLDDDAHAIFTDISARAGGRQRARTPGTSGAKYVAALLRDADAEWRYAVAILRDAGWTPAQMIAACEALLDWQLELDPDAMAKTVAGLGRQWEALAAGIREAGNAAALYTVAREWGPRANPRVHRELRGETAVTAEDAA